MSKISIFSNVYPLASRRGYPVTCPTCHRPHIKPWHTSTQRSYTAELCTFCFLELKR